jgi:hypothetical protein
MNVDPASLPPLEPNEPEVREPESGRWLIFFIALLAPAVLTAGTSKTTSGLALDSMFLGSPVAGLICAAIVPLSPSRTGRERGAIRLGVFLAFTLVSLVLCFAGCAFGNTR